MKLAWLSLFKVSSGRAPHGARELKLDELETRLTFEVAPPTGRVN